MFEGEFSIKKNSVKITKRVKCAPSYDSDHMGALSYDISSNLSGFRFPTGKAIYKMLENLVVTLCLLCLGNDTGKSFCVSVKQSNCSEYAPSVENGFESKLRG